MPNALMPTARAIREIMLAFGRLPIEHHLCQHPDFRILARVIDDAVPYQGVMRSLYIEFLRGGGIELQVRFLIGGRLGRPHPGAALLLNGDTGAAAGADFVRRVSPRLFGLYEYVGSMIVDQEYDEASWTVELFDSDTSPGAPRSALALEAKHGLIEAAAEYLAKRRDLEESMPVTAAFRKSGLGELLLRVIHRR